MGLIKKLEVKSLVSGDKSASLVIYFQPTDDLLDKLNRLHRADCEVAVGIADNNNQQEDAV